MQLALDLIDDAETSAGDAVRDFQARRDPRGLAAAYTCLGRANAARGDTERGRLLLDEALTLARRWKYPLETTDAEAALRSLDAGPPIAPVSRSAPAV